MASAAAPVYPAVLAWFLVAAMTRRRRVLQAALGAVVAALLLLLAEAMTGSLPVATAAALGWALQYKDWELSLRLWSEPLATAVLLLFVLAWRRAVRGGRWPAAGLAGALSGVAALTRRSCCSRYRSAS
ncbi:MAG: hypothetical protein U0802_22765 [Candidatus Binatia bacterium]